MRKTVLYFVVSLFATLQPCYSQVEWEQKLDGWIDGQNQPYLFLGGSYYTKVSFADIDADGDYDMFYGGGGTGSFRLFENIGTPQEPQFQLKDIVHPGLMLPYKDMTLDADFADLDDDGDFDIIVCLYHWGGGSNRFENAGDSSNPIWEIPPYGEQIALPTVGPISIHDYDQDGDYDIISGVRNSSIFYTEQIDDPFPLYFHIADTSLGDINPGSFYFIDVEDLDADHDYDLIVCVTGGTNEYYENIGGPGIDSLE